MIGLIIINPKHRAVYSKQKTAKVEAKQEKRKNKRARCVPFFCLVDRLD